MKVSIPNISQSVVLKIEDERLLNANVELFIKRDDLIDSEISGNKWRKLKFNIEQSRVRKNPRVITFGGAYSNHLVATAAACKLHNIESIGIVRGEELTSESNDTLKRCSEYGMQLIFVSREEYSLRSDREYHEGLILDYPNSFIVPEGGANYYGMIGCQEILKEISESYDRMVVAQGTTTTSCGLLLGMKENQMLSVVPVLKGFNSIEEMRTLLSRTGIESEFINELLETRLEVWDQYHFGGYAKYNEEILHFIAEFYQRHEVKLDPVYTGKAMFALYDAVKKGEISNEKIVFIHTGGVQGAKGIIEKSGFELYPTKTATE